MAIVIEEERKPLAGLFALLVWLAILAAVAAAVYYLFFKRPDLIVDIPVPANFRNTQELSQINLSPDSIFKNPTYQALQKDVILTPVASSTGKANPFQPF
ncbi:MAG: hypothetical protein HY978_03115 [Candidatus Liptonbacteria bacterium]|nr:hypothetical protein [Candidatus Liptonbacteria bacterium]